MKNFVIQGFQLGGFSMNNMVLKREVLKLGTDHVCILLEDFARMVKIENLYMVLLVLVTIVADPDR